MAPANTLKRGCLSVGVLFAIPTIIILFGDWGNQRWSQIARYRAKARLTNLETGLAAFKSEYGHYPICEDIQSGSNILYQTLFGDYNGDGVPDDEADVKTFVGDLQPPKLDSEGQPIGGRSQVRDIDGEYHVVDPWGNPVYYMCYRRGSGTVDRGGGLHNPTYDLWSIANDFEGDESKWIKNW